MRIRENRCQGVKECCEYIMRTGNQSIHLHQNTPKVFSLPGLLPHRVAHCMDISVSFPAHTVDNDTRENSFSSLWQIRFYFSDLKMLH